MSSSPLETEIVPIAMSRGLQFLYCIKDIANSVLMRATMLKGIDQIMRPTSGLSSLNLMGCHDLEILSSNLWRWSSITLTKDEHQVVALSKFVLLGPLGYR